MLRPCGDSLLNKPNMKSQFGGLGPGKYAAFHDRDTMKSRRGFSKQTYKIRTESQPQVHPTRVRKPDNLVEESVRHPCHPLINCVRVSSSSEEECCNGSGNIRRPNTISRRLTSPSVAVQARCPARSSGKQITEIG